MSIKQFDRKNQKNVQNSTEYTSVLLSEQKNVEKDEIICALIKSPHLSIFTRYFVPIIMMVNIYFFVASHSMLGGTLLVFLDIGAFQTQQTTISTFSMVQTDKDLWNAGLYPLVILLMTFSCFWPYIKIILMGLCWVLDGKHINYERREKILVILDTLGKWSFFDTYVVAILVVGFRFTLSIAKIEAQVLVRVEYAYYALVIGTVMSLLLTHLMLYWHRGQRPVILECTSRENLGNLIQTVKWRYYFVIFTIITCVALLIVGVCISSFTFDFYGLAGFLLAQEGRDKIDESFIQMGIDFADKALEPNNFGIRFIQVIYFLMGLVFPLIFAILLMVIWVVPLKIKLQRQLFFLTEILNAWSAIDVFIIAIIASLVYSYLIGENCDAINDYIKLLVKEGLIDLKGYDTCFTLETKLKTGSIILFGSAFLFVLSGTLILRQCQNKLTKRIEKIQEIQ